MKAHFIASVGELDDDIEKYRSIISAIKKAGIKLTHEWLEDAYKKFLEGKHTDNIEAEWQRIYKENREAVSNADVIIAEISSRSFLVGFQVGLAFHMKKPILLLTDHDRTKGGLGVSMNEDIIKFSRYDKTNIDAIIQSFAKENSINPKDLRFNFFIDRKILNFLNSVSFETGETKSEIIRKLLMKEIDRL